MNKEAVPSSTASLFGSVSFSVSTAVDFSFVHDNAILVPAIHLFSFRKFCRQYSNIQNLSKQL